MGPTGERQGYRVGVRAREVDSDSDGGRQRLGWRPTATRMEADRDSDGGRQRLGWRPTALVRTAYLDNPAGLRQPSARPALLAFTMVSEYCVSVLVCLCLCVRGCDLSMRLECLSGSFSRSRTVKLIHDAITCLVNDPLSESHFRVVISESRRASQTASAPPAPRT